MKPIDAQVQQLERALSKVVEALEFPRDEPHRESLIQRFEYTFELSWKLMSRILDDELVPAQGVRTVLRKAADLGLISDVAHWLSFATSRNETSHLYLEEVAIRVEESVRDGFAACVQDLLQAVKARLG